MKGSVINDALINKEDKSTVDYVVYDHVKGSPIYDFVVEPLPEKVCRYFFRQILSGLTYLHSKGIYHLNLKNNNIIVQYVDWKIKLNDYGMYQGFKGQKSGLQYFPLGVPNLEAHQTP